MSKNEKLSSNIIYKNIDDTMTGLNNDDIKNKLPNYKDEHNTHKHKHKQRDKASNKNDNSSSSNDVLVLLDNLLDSDFLNDYFKDIDDEERVNIINSQTRTHDSMQTHT
jgi:hypothetical protein